MAFFNFATAWQRRDPISSRPAILLVPSPGSQIARMGLFIAAGSAQDGKSGTAHMLEHLVYDQHLRLGWPKRPTSQLNALTSWFWTGYFWEGASSDLDAALRHFSTLVAVPALQQDLIDKHRKILALELKQRLTAEPLLAEAMALHARAFSGTGLAAPPLGRPDDIATLTRDEVEAFRAEYYTPDRAVLVVAAPPEAIACHRRSGHVLDFSRPPAPIGQLPEVTRTPATPGIPAFHKSDVVTPGGRHLLFAVLGHAGLPLADGLLAMPLLSAWLTRDAPGSLAERLKPLALAPSAIDLLCILSPAGQPAVIGSVSLGNATDAQAAAGLVADTFRALPQIDIDSTIGDTIEQRAAHLRPQPWSSAGLLQFGSAAATYGIAAALESHYPRQGQSHVLINRVLRTFAGLA